MAVPRSIGVLLALLFVGTALPAAAATSAPAAAPRPFGIEDVFRVQTPGELELSPDGKTLLYTLASSDLPRGKRNRDLYRLAVAGGEPQRLTFTADKGEGSPLFSPDGRSVAFVATRGEHPALWLMAADGGEARQLVEVSTGIGDPVWSPDGRHIAFVSEVYPACGADDACNQKRAKERSKGPLKAHVADDLLYRHWTSWYDGKVNHVLVVEVATGKVRDLTPGDREAPVFGLDGGCCAFSPDGRELAYTRNPDPRDQLARSTNSDLWIVPVDPDPDGKTQPARNLTAANPAWDGDASFSPDGRWLAYRRQTQPGYESDRFTLMLLDRRTGATRELTPRFDSWVSSYEWRSDSSGLVFKADEKGQTPLFEVRLGGDGAVRRLAAFQTLDGFELSADGRSAFVVRSSVGEPAEIWRLDLAGSAPPQRLTRHNAELAREVDIRPAEQHWVEGTDGTPIHVFVVKPHGFDPTKKYPVIVNVHGGPQMMWADSFRGDWQVYPGAGYIVVFPNPHGSTGYGQTFTARISGDYTGAVMNDIHKVTDWIAAQSYADPQRIGAMGWSWGGYAMYWLMGTTDRYKAYASMMGLFDLPSFYGATEELWFPEWDFKGTPWTSDLYQRHNPAALATKMKTPTLVLTGELDYRVAYTQSLMAFTTLRRQGVPAKLVVFPDAGHWPSWYEMALYYTAHLEWFHTYLGGAPPPWTTEAFAANAVFDPETGKRR